MVTIVLRAAERTALSLSLIWAATLGRDFWGWGPHTVMPLFWTRTPNSSRHSEERGRERRVE
jgi:hypothetical protein